MGNPDYPGYENPSITGSQGQKVMSPFGGMMTVGGQQGLPQGQQLQDYAMGLMTQGLPKDIQDAFIKQGTGALAGQKREREQQLSQRVAGSGGNVPIGAQLAGEQNIASTQSQGTEALYSDLASKNFGAKQQGFSNMGALTNEAMEMSEMKNQYNAQKAQYDAQPSFLEQMAGGLLGAGGDVAGAAAGRAGK